MCDLQGVYVYSQTSRTGRRLINIVDMSHTVSDSVQQIIRGPDEYDQILWQKVSEGNVMFTPGLMTALFNGPP